jgi:c-di-GMP-related signal transduction protein
MVKGKRMDIFIARQPIFDKDMNVYGYELLYREENMDSYTSDDGDKASSSVITGGFLSTGIENITGGKKAFVNFTRGLISEKIVTLFPKQSIVVEILETVAVDDEILSACENMKRQGYTIALDDFVFDPSYEFLLDYTDIIKIDFIHSEEDYIKNIVMEYGDRNIKFLAEKVETVDEYKKAVDYGYELFQGYFFSKPVIVSTNVISPYRMNYLNVLRLIHEEEIDFTKLTSVIEKDISFSYDILKLVNTVHYYRGNKIRSIRQALMYLGELELKKWLYLVVLRKLGTRKQEEIINICMIRARFLELLCIHLHLERRSPEFMMLGMFSLIDVLLNISFDRALTLFPFSEEIKDIMSGAEKESKMALCFKLVLAYERGDWLEAEDFAARLKISAQDVPTFYQNSLEWVAAY